MTIAIALTSYEAEDIFDDLYDDYWGNEDEEEQEYASMDIRLRMNESFGCNFAVYEGICYDIETLGMDKVISELLDAFSHSYARCLLVNYRVMDGVLPRTISRLAEHFPIKAQIPVPSSMGNYCTTLFMFDVTGVEKRRGWTGSVVGKWFEGETKVPEKEKVPA